MRDFFLGVITPTGATRNPNLISRLKPLFNEILVNGFFGEQIFKSGSGNLTFPEAGCKYSHSKMYEAAKDYKWALIVEDDADINIRMLEILMSKLTLIDSKKPIIVSCYLGKWSVLRLDDLFNIGLKSLFPPDGTLCYFINQAAIQLANQEFELIRPADWPSWSRKVNFIVAPGIAREYSKSISTIDPQKARLLNQKSLGKLFNEFFGIAYWKYFGFKPRTFKEIWFWVYRQRIIWYFPRLFKACRSAKFSENLFHKINL